MGNEKDKNGNFTDTAKSVAAAFFGVQSEANRERDFTKGKLSHFIVAGLIAVVLFIGVLLLTVSMVIP